VPPFKSDGRVNRQAVRFRVFEFVRDGGQWTVSREVSLAEGNPNIKRRNSSDDASLEIDPLPRSIGGRSAGPVEMSKGTSDAPAQER